jgi:predicted ester cyclase
MNKVAPAPTDHRDRVTRIYTDCINQGRLELLPDLVSPDYVGPNGERGPDGFRQIIEGLRAGFPDIRFAIEDARADGDRVIIRWRWQGTHLGNFRGIAPSKKQVSSTGIVIYQLTADRIVKSWLETDRLGVLQQVGAIPEGLVPRPPPLGSE